MTREELAAAQQRQQQQQQRTAVQTIQVGPGPAQQQPPIEVTQGPAQVRPQAPPPNVVTPNAPAPDAPVAITTTPRPPGGNHPLQGVATRHGEELVTVGSDGAARPQQTGVPMTPLREYKAQTGDSLSRIAARFMGSASKANRDAIVRANPSLHQQPDRIIEGRVYLIPLPAQVEAQPQAQAQPQAVPAPASSVSQGFTWYTVKENDNLWKIASEQCGTGNAWADIKDLNKDVLRNGETVRPNMRIRIPARPVASAS
jgi:nucleoid-associated protein YgaU